MINKQELELLADALKILEEGSHELPEFTPQIDADTLAPVLDEVARRMQDNYPYFHPQYAGQMLKPPHPVARIAYALSLWVNPNNHALDGGRASSAMEKECIVELGRLFGWDRPLGHLTSSGTIANLEALWIAGKLRPGQRVLASEQAHYTHGRITDVLGIPYAALAVDESGRIDVAALETQLQRGDVGTVVVTIGTTGLGVVDPLVEILELRKSYDFRIHADAAYGGYFGLSSLLGEETRATFEAMNAVDSIVIDPHKHGLQPYGCGCILFRDPSVGTLYKHGSPYTYFSSDELHLGEISLECSRAGASAVALWATMRLMPLEPEGELAQGLDSSLRAAQDFYQRLKASEQFVPLMPPELDIVVYAARAHDALASSARAREVFERAAKRDLHLALADFPSSLVAAYAPDMMMNADTVTCLRSVLMKPEHEDWIDRITALLEASAAP
jgi:glutamate/tyrosine decarboxylase-like PLP-dependent enzyme